MDAVANKIEIREVSQRKTAYLFIKRVFDIVLSLVLIVVLLPLLLLVMAAIAIDSPGPVIFKQKRIGYQGKEFVIFKFRTLSITAPDNVATRKLENIDGCSTKLGRLLRRLSIDELPQLFNILRGDMSFVGFRPVCTSEKKLNALRRKMGVFEGRPGLTGYAQVLGRDCGMWSSLEELQALRCSDRVFLPQRIQSECDEEYRLWKRAVSRAADWIEH